jgi:hypothetical protein
MRKIQPKEKSLYRELVAAAWSITKERRHLWFLGLGAAILMMNGGAADYLFRTFVKVSSGDPYSGLIAAGRAVVSAVGTGDNETRIGIFAALLLGAAIFTLVGAMAVASSGGLLSAVGAYLGNKKMSAREAFSRGMEKLGPLVVTQIVGRTILFFIFTFSVLGVYIYQENALNLAVSIGLLLVFAVAAIIIPFLMVMTNAGIMLKRLGWMEAVGQALVFFRRHWLVSLEMIVIVFAVSVLAALAVILIGVVLIIPFTILFFAFSTLGATSVAGVAIMTMVFQPLMILLIILAGAILAVFEHAAWVGLYLRFSDRGALAKLERIWNNITFAKFHDRIFRR